MVYSAWEGWYKEEPNLNTLLPHDIMRIIVQLEAWGDTEKAKEVIPQHEVRLNQMVEDNLQFKIGEIELDFEEEQQRHDEIVEKLKEDTLDAKTASNLEKQRKKWLKELIKKEDQIADAKINSEKEKEAIQNVKKELLDMFEDPELRKKYFSVVDMEEIEENEFNLNIPRYVDTFEPEEEINLKNAIKEFNHELKQELETTENLKKLIDGLKNV